MADLVSLNQIPTVTALYATKKLVPAASASATPSAHLNDKISLIRNDITKLEVDAIVNAANETLLGGGGVDGAIHSAAGPELYDECLTLDGCPTGSAKITSAYELPCKRVIHAVGPVYASSKRAGQHTSLLQGCYRRALELAVEHECRSVAFSALSTGVYGYPSEEAAETALGEVRRFLEGGEEERGKGLDRVVFCSFLEKDEKAYEKLTPVFFPPADNTPETNEKASTEQKGIGTTSESPVAQLPGQTHPAAVTRDEGERSQTDQLKVEFSVKLHNPSTVLIADLEEGDIAGAEGLLGHCTMKKGAAGKYDVEFLLEPGTDYFFKLCSVKRASAKKQSKSGGKRETRNERVEPTCPEVATDMKLSPTLTHSLFEMSLSEDTTNI
ncbi:MAG: hypothetical protein M1822_005199 [Bathelium mastoideum]|nr:MAG: hypothetical protein M1822_005199 [Bathelium mastoideum]